MKNFFFSVNNANDNFSVKSYPKNSVIVIASRYNADGTRTNNVLNVPELKKTDRVSVVKHLLRCIVAECRMQADFNDEYGTYTNDESESKKTGIRCRKIFGAYLQSDTIYRTDADGKLIPVLTITDGKLSQTALNISGSMAIANESYNSSCFRNLVHQTAKAICDQCEWVANVNENIDAIDTAVKALPGNDAPKQLTNDAPGNDAAEQPEQLTNDAAEKVA